MTNRELIITGLQENDWEIDRIVTGFIECPYIRDSDCENPYKYGTSDFQIFCDEQCKTEWLDKLLEDFRLLLDCDLCPIDDECDDTYYLCQPMTNDYCGGHHDCKYYPNCENLSSVQKLPSAQPESCGDVISREYLKEHIEACWINSRPRHTPELNELLSWIDDVPSAQTERKKGKWIEITSSNHSYKCSVCGRLLVNITDGKNNVTKNYPYCHCGADMREEVE